MCVSVAQGRDGNRTEGYRPTTIGITFFGLHRAL